MKKNIKRIVLIIIGVMIPLSAVIYFNIYYHADENAVKALESTDSVTVSAVLRGYTAFVPDSPDFGLIFYPGAKVEYTSYAPLMQHLADGGVLCVIAEMPLKLAFTKQNAADGIPELFPSVKKWYIGGHSLGGVIAAKYAQNNSDKLDGIILLASYSVYDISSSGMNVISIYGDSDRVLNIENYQKNRTNLPDGFHEYVIEGGCHSYFGSYGDQKGDGEPSLSREEQQKITAEYIVEKINA